jgi:hypothetical protein
VVVLDTAGLGNLTQDPKSPCDQSSSMKKKKGTQTRIAPWAQN